MNALAPPVVISGVGLVTPLGRSAEETWNSLLAGRFIRDHGRVIGDLPEAQTRVSRLGIGAAQQAIAGWSDVERREAALVIGTSKGPIHDWLNTPSALSDLEDGFGIASLGGEIARRFAIGGPVLTTCSACASGLHALIRGVMLIQNGDADRVLVVAAESSLHSIFLSCFQKLGVLAPVEIGCRPFDINRAGFLASEASAAVCLERAQHNDARPRVRSFAMAADAFHLTRTSEENEPLKRAIATAADGQELDLIHAHGTGTVHNDPTEIAAIRASIGAQAHLPSLYSHKGALGHSSGAAGLISIVINVLAHRHGIIPPNARLEHPIAGDGLRIEAVPVSRPVYHSIAIAAGFGGHIAAVSLAS